jgi:hypothetical protein
MEEVLSLLDERLPDVRLEFGIARAEVAHAAIARAQAEQLSAIAATLREARDFPELYVGPSQLGPTAVEFAERAAIADLAVRLNLAESTVRAQAFEADTLRTLTPRLWQAFREGEVSAANASTVAALCIGLTDAACQTFEAKLLHPAATLAPARFRAMARAIRERLVAEAPAERHERAAETRRVILEPDVDGMAWLHAYLPAETAQRAMRHVTRIAKELGRASDETRTLGQLRADVAGDLLAGVLGAKGSVGVTVGVTVPVLTLLGGDEPGILEGHGPIDSATARRLAAHAPSFHRILTHPITGTVVDVDRTRYSPPADLKRMVGLRDVVCTFPGCGRSSRECDLDHTIAWDDDGKTAETNLASLCRHHHRLKHETNWSVDRSEGVSTWTSPTGAIRTSDPPPF